MQRPSMPLDNHRMAGVEEGIDGYLVIMSHEKTQDGGLIDIPKILWDSFVAPIITLFNG